LDTITRMARSPDRSQRITTARTQLLDRGAVTAGLLPEPIERSWSRCMTTGLSAEAQSSIAPIAMEAFKEIWQRNAHLLDQALPAMDSLYAQIVGTNSMVILTDAFGTILHSLGDSDFISKAQRVALQPGVSWREEITGTNAIGTALVERKPVRVEGREHYFEQNAFLTCSAAPILDYHGQTIGILDISNDCHQPQAHTMSMVRMSAQMIENRLLASEFPHDIIIRFHMRPEFLGTLWEGMAVFSPDGRLLAANKIGLFQLGLNGGDLQHLVFAGIFDCPLPAMLDSFKRAAAHGIQLSTHTGLRLHARLDAGPVSDTPRTTAPSRPRAEISRPDLRPLDALNTGDEKMHQAILMVKKVIEKGIPILIEGETGTGKEMLAKGIHLASARHANPFIAINCASIPEGLIEAELFGYEEGAFTGAKRKGVPGKILQANNGTLFLDEIGEMPMSLQARLLRVLQEREITPLGSGKSIPVNITLVCATNRKLMDHVEQGHFREDLYYRINGLRVRLPPLRERTDLGPLITRILHEEQSMPVTLDQIVLDLFQRHPWRGNIRQLRNVLKAALAFVDDTGHILPRHLPEDFIEEAAATAKNTSTKTASSIRRAERQLIQQALNDHDQNIALAARQLGISRATLYRKIKAEKL